MRIAFSIWDNRIAPVFDTANDISIIDVTSGEMGEWLKVVLPVDLPLQKILRLVELKVDILVCGAISKEMHKLIDAYGFQVLPFVTGDVSEIFEAFISDQRDWSCFAMPGCEAPGRRLRLRGQFSPGKHRRCGFRRKHG